MSKKAKEALAKELHIEELFNDLDVRLDEKAYLTMARTCPMVVTAVEELVSAGVTPEGIMAHILGKYPHMWVEAQAVRAVARHLGRELA